MAKKKEKILTQKQMEDIVLFVYNMVRDEYSMNFLKERTIGIENDDHVCRIITTMFNDCKTICLINIDNKVTKKSITLALHDITDKSNISKQLNYLQNRVDVIIEENQPVFYDDDEIEDIIGDPALLARRSVKVEHLIDNIEEKKNLFSRLKRK